MAPKPAIPPNPRITHGKSSARKSAPKPPLPAPERLKRLFTSLCAQIDGGHFANAVKTCDKILRLSPADPDALQTKLFLLLQTEQYIPALALIDSGAASSPREFERAYSLYRLQHEDEAREVLKGLDGGERGVLHLEAQLNYREGSYEKAYEVYNHLLDTAEPNSEEHTDILTNLHAAQLHLEFITSSFQRSLSALPAALTAGLENAAPPAPPSSLHPTTTTTTQPPTQQTPQAQTQAQKKPRLSRVPASVVPGVTPPPDPERWLKKSERSTFNAGKQRRKGAGGGGGATQGSSAVDVPVAVPSGGGKAKGKKRK